MHLRRNTIHVAAIAVTAVLASPAWAGYSPQGCRKAIASYSKAVAAYYKSVPKCHKRLNATPGAELASCNSVSYYDRFSFRYPFADEYVLAQWLKAAGKASSAVDTACEINFRYGAGRDPWATSIIVGNYGGSGDCPFGFCSGLFYSIADYDVTAIGLGSSQQGGIMSVMEGSSARVVGAQNLGGNAVKAKCVQTIAAQQAKIVSEILTNSNKCQAALDTTAVTFGSLDASCRNAGVKASAKAMLTIPKACPGLSGADVGSCEPLPSCVVDASVEAAQIIAAGLYYTIPPFPCTADSECPSGACAIGSSGVPVPQCVYYECTDGVRDDWESDVDCGGRCQACPAGAQCSEDYDCASLRCEAGLCQSYCAADSDCPTDYVCTAWFETGHTQCVPTSCADGSADYPETDIDCGGGNCTGCATGGACEHDRDCASTSCVSGVCE